MATIFSKDNTAGKSYIAFFDLDGTIIRVNSGRALVHHAYNKGMMSWYVLLKAIYTAMIYRMNLKDTLKIINDMVSWVAGLTVKTMQELSSEVSVNVLIPSIRSEVISGLDIHRKHNAKVVMLSSSLKPVCQEVASYLGMDDILCSELEVVNGYYTGRPLGRFCIKEEKAARLKKYCEINNSDMADAWYYGDSIDDNPALSIVGHPVCINPDNKLKKIALEKGWKVYQWH